MDVLYNWVQEFIKGLYNLWNWLITPLGTDSVIGELLELIGISELAPIYLVVGGALLIGLVRRLL